MDYERLWFFHGKIHNQLLPSYTLSTLNFWANNDYFFSLTFRCREVWWFTYPLKILGNLETEAAKKTKKHPEVTPEGKAEVIQRWSHTGAGTDFWKGFRKINNQRQQKWDSIKHQQQSAWFSFRGHLRHLRNTNASSSSPFHIWKNFRDCKYLEVLWQWTIPRTWLGNCYLCPELSSYLTSSENGQEKKIKAAQAKNPLFREAICNFFLYFALMVYYCTWTLKVPFKVPGLSILFLVLRRRKTLP